MSAGEMEQDAAPAATAGTFGELAEELALLRAHLHQVLEDLHAPREARLRCRECGRLGTSGDSGWTLRLCADDELHAFCPDCDERYVGTAS